MQRYPNVSSTPDKFDNTGNKLCRNCDNLISQGRRHYCSEKCMDEFNRNNSWFWIRKDILKRDKYTCSICDGRFRKGLLDVDHIIPINMGGALFDKRNLRVLCKYCHKAKGKLDSWAKKHIK